MTTLTDTYAWGDPQIEFKGNTNSNLLRLLLFGALTLGTIYAAFSGFFTSDGFSGGILFGLFWLLLAAYFGRYLWHHIQARRESVGIYNDGVVRKRGDNVEMIRWDEMVESSQNLYTFRLNFIPIYKREEYRVKTQDGTTHLFRGSIPDAKRLGGILHTQVARQVLPEMIERYNAGETITFGKVGVNKEGLHQGNKSLAWSDMKGMTMRNGQLTFKKEGKWLSWGSMQINNTPNFVALLDLLEAITGMRLE